MSGGVFIPNAFIEEFVDALNPQILWENKYYYKKYMDVDIGINGSSNISFNKNINNKLISDVELYKKFSVVEYEYIVPGYNYSLADKTNANYDALSGFIYIISDVMTFNTSSNVDMPLSKAVYDSYDSLFNDVISWSNGHYFNNSVIIGYDNFKNNISFFVDSADQFAYAADSASYVGLDGLSPVVSDASKLSFWSPLGNEVTSSIDWSTPDVTSYISQDLISSGLGYGSFADLAGASFVGPSLGGYIPPAVPSFGYGSGVSGWGYFDYGSGGGFSVSGGVSFSFPVVLDLNGDGVSIVESTDSDTYMDMEGDGTVHRTAWAGAGDGVLVYDRTGSGDVENPQAFQFTQYSPGAESDMEALADVFDSNGDGKLSAADDAWAKFKVLLTTSRGGRQLMTLDELGITEILLSPDDNEQNFSDGSQILGSANFVRNGKTYAAADTVLAYDSEGDLIRRTSTRQSDGSTVVDLKAYATDGTFATETITTISADGLSRTLMEDLDGDGLFESRQTRVSTKDSDGTRTMTVSNFDVTGALTDNAVTVRSSNGKTTTISTDLDGNGTTDRLETRVTGVGTRVTITNLAPDGSVVGNTVTTATAVTATGHTRLQRSDVDGDGTYELTRRDATVVNADGSEVETIELRSGDGGSGSTLLSSTTLSTRADGKVTSTAIDSDGDGTIDLTRVTGLSVSASGNTTTTETTRSASGIVLGKTVTTVGANGLTRLERVFSGSSTADQYLRDETVVATNGSSTRTVRVTAGNDTTLLSQQTLVWSEDGLTRTLTNDANGDGRAESVEAIEARADGTKTDTLSLYAGTTLVSLTNTVIAADGKSRITTRALNSAKNVSETEVGQTVTNADGSVTTSVSLYEGAYSASTKDVLRSLTTVTTSANGLKTVTRWDLDGDGIIDGGQTDTLATGGDGSQTETVEITNANGSRRSLSIAKVSANRLTTSLSEDFNGDRVGDRNTVSTTAADGSVTTTVVNYNLSRKAKDTTTTKTSADRLSATTKQDLNGDGVTDVTRADVVTHAADGSTVETVRDFNGTTLTQLARVTTSGNGLTQTTEQDLDGDGTFDATILDASELLSDGSTRETVTNTGLSVLGARVQVVTTSADGRSITTQVDADGNRTYETVTSDVTVLDVDGDQTRTVSVLSGEMTPKLISRTTTATSPRGNVSVRVDLDGDGATDQAISTTRSTDGRTTVTRTDYNSDRTQKGRVQTVTSANGLSVTTRWYDGADTAVDRSRSDVTARAADGSTTRTVTDLDAGNLATAQAVVWCSGDGLNDIAQWDFDGDGVFDTRKDYLIEVGTDGARTETVSNYKLGSGATSPAVLFARRQTIISADQLTTTETFDRNGDGRVDQKTVSVLQAGATKADDDLIVTTAQDLTKAGVVSDQRIIAQTSTGQTTTTQWDSNGDGAFEAVLMDEVVLAADGRRVETMTYAAGASSKDVTVVTTQASGASVTTQWNLDGAGAFDSVKTDETVVSASRTTHTISYFDGTGKALKAAYAETSSADGLTRSRIWNVAGSGGVNQSSSDKTTLNADGTRTRVATAMKGGNKLSSSITTTSASGLSTIIKSDFDGNGTLDRMRSITSCKNVDGSLESTLVDATGDGKTVVGQSSTFTSADGRTMTTNCDADGDGKIDQKIVIVTGVDGRTNSTTFNYGRDGKVSDTSATSVSVDGLTTTTQWDFDGDGEVDQTRTDGVADYADGHRVETVTDVAADGALVQKGVMTTSADGRTITLRKDTDGDKITDHTETTSVDADGSSRTSIIDRRSDGSLSRAITTVSADGLTRVSDTDVDGDGHVDYTETSQQNIDGSVTIIGHHLNYKGVPQDEIKTSVTADGSLKTVRFDKTNDGIFDQVEVIETHLDGSTTTSLSGADFNSVASVSANGKSKIVEVTSRNGMRTFVDGDDNAIKLADGTIDTVVTGENNTITINNGSIIVASGASVTVKGSNAVIIAAHDATVTADSSARVFRVQANVSYMRGAPVDSMDVVGTDQAYLATYIDENGADAVYYIGQKLISRAQFINSLQSAEKHGPLLQATHIFLNGSEAAYRIAGNFPVPYMKIGVYSSGGLYNNLTSLQLDASGYVGATDAFGNWVTAFGETPVYLSGSNQAYISDFLTGGDGDDTIDGGLGKRDILRGGAGDDTILFDQASYDASGQWDCSDYYEAGFIAVSGWQVDGGDGYDTAILNSSVNAVIDLADGHFEALIANKGNDVIKGNSAVEGYIDGGAGNDNITGGAKADVLIGGDGNDLLNGSSGDDLLEGGAGDDILSGGAGADVLDGGAGVDTVSYASSTASVKVTLRSGGAQTTASGASGSEALGDVIRNVENITGSAFNDTLTGNSGTNILDGGKGADTLNGGGGSDTLKGGGGLDTYIFGASQKSEIIVNGVSGNTGPSGELEIAFDSENLWFIQSGDDLIIDVLGTTRKVVVKDWYDGASSRDWEQLSVISAKDGLELTSAQQVNTLVQAMASFANDYQAENGIAFDPTAAANATITDATLVAAQGKAWHS
ncbi:MULTISPECIES: hypothetical protein [unclassified Xanthobacter]|uniref:hypothetical protein n=1 Tax=unclassified Xanthobacter TaxID=2623496 RepID=UPI001F18A8AC|nr:MULTISPECIES: hypothetical protein [unclassified Xanthobacter]